LPDSGSLLALRAEPADQLYKSGVTVRPSQAGQTAGALRCWTLLPTT
jgi:hypothetical protein